MVNNSSYFPEYYKELTFEKMYNEKEDPPPFDLNMDLSSKTLSELRILRNTIFARHGYLFMDSVIRGYFNQFAWYQPVFWDLNFKIELSKEEEAFIARVKEQEVLRLTKNKVDKKGVTLGNMENIVNIEMFKTMPDEAFSLLKDRNFFLKESGYEQLYNVYEKNYYDGLPSYITADLYLELLHVYYKHLLMGLEKYDLYPLARDLIKGMYSKTLAIYTDKVMSEDIKPALEFNLIYLAIAGNLLKEELITPPDSLLEQYKIEYSACLSATLVGSAFLKDEYFDYSQLKPRGSYEYDNSLGLYFRGIKWLDTAPMFYGQETGLMSAVIFALILQEDPDLLDEYNRFEKVIAAFAGEEDNLSPLQILKVINDDNRFRGTAFLADRNLLAELGKRLQEIDPEKMHPKGGTKTIADSIGKPRVLFFPSRYSFDGYILQNMVHPLLAGDGYRLYPKGLDIFASLGNSEAEKILLQEYNETETWPGYAGALNKMKEEFAGFNDWGRNLFNKRMNLILSLTETYKPCPGFMQTASWQRRALIASLAGWTEAKSELVLYQKQPIAAEAGEGGGSPPLPVTPGYVEPNLAFWQGCLDLLEMTLGILDMDGFSTDKRRGDLAQLYIMAEELLEISRKELKGETVSDAEFRRIEAIGGRAEYLTKALKDEWSENVPYGMGLVTDVYSYYGPDGGYCLEEATGNADTIWVVAEINGLLYLTRGATFTYFEFIEPTPSRLTEGEWHVRLYNKKIPERPAWTKDLYSQAAPEVKTGYSHTSYPVSSRWKTELQKY